MSYMPWGIGLFGLMWLVVPVLVVVLIVWAVSNRPPQAPPPGYGPPAPPSPSPPRPPDTPLDILARRFASGEITAEEYTKARDLLQGGKPPAG